eukprot:TRINITY_DN2281_c0_g2_i1.p1 TRINITY_DN2281_c0_g2~~TRINITY_DN2281_c0_g2_i1.p1  ORF type:complete len:309 (+),score=68.64 TRINITY_DN2281_c0_g2_i1:69-995(+)
MAFGNIDRLMNKNIRDKRRTTRYRRRSPVRTTHRMKSQQWIDNMRIYPFVMEMDFVPPELEYGGKIGLSVSKLAALYESSPTSKIFMLELFNIETNKSITVGVAPETFQSDNCFAPTWLMQQLELNPGDVIMVKSVQCPPIKEAVLQPVENAFMELSDPRSVLEKTLLNHTCLTVGQTIVCMHLQREYEINVISLEPTDAVCIIDCDLPYHMLDALDAPTPPPPEDMHHNGYVRGLRVPTEQPWKFFDDENEKEEEEKSFSVGFTPSPTPIAPWETPSPNNMENKQKETDDTKNNVNDTFSWGKGDKI